jgi:AcrR family transcriptional regulator
VQRLTVYRHFPDEAELFAACAAHTAAEHPPPDPAPWLGIRDPAERLEAALGALYGYYRIRERGLANVLRDAERLPALAEALAPMAEHLRWMAERLAAGWVVDAEAERTFRAALGHTLNFWSWRSLAGQGLGDAEAAGLMGRLVSAAARAERNGP